ncbi:MAG TPA: hypothetical protein VH740_08865 [Vicinamibacterales bacterium]
MSRHIAAVWVCLIACAIGAAPAQAQFNVPSSRATGESYKVEISGSLWDPAPSIFIVSESIQGVPGTRIDFVEDLGIEKNWFKQLKVVLRPDRQHKFRFEFTPIHYKTQATLGRDLVFNGILFPAAARVDTEVKWNAFRFGYEYDFFYRDRGFIGLVLDVKYTDIRADINSTTDTEFVHARAPIPAIGLIGRGYVAPNVAITAEFTFIKIPEIDEKYGGRFFDLDIYGTVNFTENVGAQGGYRSFDVIYHADADDGDLQIRGIYFGGVVRF